ncbi:aldehyde dehydrogenase [Hwangdonia lutea]|uniref:Aldehyde dehydrogenase n=1 Tax=Hwangdonia lutea TaxID=3075823 RepID=A0AA97HRR3_9FLAO|nr:aldehyde dehydrogenase [Hwangdonia sp. SCSIO 19198]WOD43758.1 aldehyde dehydrogenase [Hwangdonia sp. SCSIO 19198]
MLNTIPEIISNQKTFFKAQNTKDVSFRISLLKKLKQEIISREKDIFKALHSDFKKPSFEAFLSENGLVIAEINLAIKNLKSWSKPERVKSSVLLFPSKDYIYKSPYGTVLIIGPWNYPFQLAINPLIMAIAAGNTVVLKPSELTPNTSELLAEMVKHIFPKDMATVVQGGVEISTELLKQHWDYIFFTGSVSVGKIVAKAAAKHLTPVTLELGGKSPCIVDDTINLKLTAKRLVWGKFFNGGQTCIAPDYLIVKSSIKNDLIDALKNEILKAYGDAQNSADYPKIINHKNFIRLTQLLKDVNIAFGGDYNAEELYLAPTLIDEPPLDSEVMKDEIFGPILPILSYDTEDDIASIIQHFNKPLSLYVFSKNKRFIEDTIDKFSFGGGVINDTLIHYGNANLPFGGIGASGIGAYHGKFGFDTFTHFKAIVKRGNWYDPPFRYAPYSKRNFKLIKTLFKWFS